MTVGEEGARQVMSEGAARLQDRQDIAVVGQGSSDRLGPAAKEGRRRGSSLRGDCS